MTDQVDTSPDTDTDAELPGDPVLRKELKDGIEEITASMARARGEREFQSEALKNLAKKVGMERKKVAKLARWRFKGDAAAKKEAINVTSAEAAFSILYGEAQAD